MGRLTDFFGKPADDQFQKFLGTSTDAAKPVPRGKYPCRVTKGERHTAGTGNEGYRLTFVIQGGEHAGRKMWKTYFFTNDAMAYSRGELAKFGLIERPHFDAPFPGDKVIDCTVFVTVTASERGEANDVQRLADIVIQSPSAVAVTDKQRATRATPTGQGRAARKTPPAPKADTTRRKAALKKPAGGEGEDSPTKARAKTAGPKKSAGAKGETPQRASVAKKPTGRKRGGK